MKTEEQKEYLKQWRILNKEKIKEYNKLNKEKIALQKKEWAKNNPEKINESLSSFKKEKPEKVKEHYNKSVNNRKKTDKLFKLKCNMRSSISKTLKRFNINKKNKTNEILGCSFEEFKQHLESKFKPWMTWENHGKYNGELNYGWDIDHIIPLSSGKTEEDILKLNHFSNLQPLCSKTNRDLKKGETIMLELSMDF
jgi:hypothetical protein